MAMDKKKYPGNLMCDYLQALGVAYTADYTKKRYREMPFQTLYGLTKLLEEYGVGSKGYHLSDKNEIRKIKPPFLAKTVGGLVIVTSTTPETVDYLTQGVAESIPREEFNKVWTGDVLLSFPTKESGEPHYAKHRNLQFLMQAKKWVLWACVAVLFTWLFIMNGLYRHVSTILISLIDIGGIFFTYLLVQKSLNIHNAAADRVCSVLQVGGCDSILETKASKFFGLFGWSEVGFSYFFVSLVTLLLFPCMLPWLALCNVCCLPFTVWSIWYQKWRAHKWCTLCVCVQCSLWLLFFCYLFGGWLKEAWPPSEAVVFMGILYLAVMLGLNALMPLIEKED